MTSNQILSTGQNENNSRYVRVSSVTSPTPNYFDNQAHQWLIQTTLSYFDKYHATPTLETLQVEVKKIEKRIYASTNNKDTKEDKRLKYQASFNNGEQDLLTSLDIEFIETEYPK